MSDNDIKPAGWASDDGRIFETEAEARRNAWNSASPLYDQSSIDRLTADRDALRSQLDWMVLENDRLLDDGRDLAAERDAAVADAERYRWLRTGDNDEPCLINYPEPDSIEHDSPRAYLLRMDKLDAAIDTARRDGQ